MSELSNFARNHGKEALHELLDMVFIVEKPTDAQWTFFLKKYNLLSKNSRATIRGQVRKVETRQRYEIGRGMVQLDEPYTRYTIVCVNGRNQTVFHLPFNKKELEEYQNETNPNQE